MTPALVDAVEVRNLTRRFENVVALDDVSLSVRQGEFFSLLGPSGCGKTTLLRILAGLDVASSGVVRIAGQDATDLPAYRRPVNTVFQSYALFPHFDVRSNIAFGLKMKKVPPGEIVRRVKEVMALAQIEELGARMPNQLSGGQKQRVALARAIVNEPKVLLLDEPLAALDLKLRKQLQLELRNLQHRLGITFIYVTHDQEEALVLSDRIAVMRSGKIEQLAGAKEIYERPRTRFASQFLGSCSLIEAKVRERRTEGIIVETVLGDLWIADRSDRDAFTLAIRPEKVRMLSEKPADSQNVILARVEQTIYLGAANHYELRAGSQALRAEAMNSTGQGRELTSGEPVWVYLPADSLIILHD